MQRLRRLYEEKENVDGSDKEVNSLTGPNCGGYAGRLRRLCGKITEVMREEKAMDRSVPDGSDKKWRLRTNKQGKIELLSQWTMNG